MISSLGGANAEQSCATSVAGKESRMAAKYEVKKASDGQYFFNLKAGNGEIILTSERYKAKASATNGIESVRKNAPIDARYDRRVSSNNKPYFVLRAGNNEVIGQSELYSSAAAMENGITAVKAAAPTTTVEDLA